MARQDQIPGLPPPPKHGLSFSTNQVLSNTFNAESIHLLHHIWITKALADAHELAHPNAHLLQDSERTVSAGERPQTYALDRAATETGYWLTYSVYWYVITFREGKLKKKEVFLSLFTGKRFHSVVRTWYAMHIQQNGVARSHNYCWYGNASVLSLAIFEVRISLSKCNKYWKICHGITVGRSLCGYATHVPANNRTHANAFM
jgi:hypothetical protein